MQTLGNIKKMVRDIILADSRFKEFLVQDEYSGNLGKIPLTNGILTLGVDKVLVKPSGFGGLSGIVDTRPTTGQLANITLRFDCYLPQNRPISDWDIVLDALCENLLGNKIGASQIWFDSTKEKSNILANHICVRAIIEAALTYTPESQNIREINLEYSAT